MTDELMDARLRRAGETWRAAQVPAAADVATRVETLAAAPTRKPPRARRIGLLASAAVVAAALVAAGGFLVANVGSHNGGRPPSDAGPVSLAGTNWALVTITAADGNDVPVAGDPVLSIDNSNHVGGTDGCNKFGGDVTVDIAVIHIGALEKSEMTCPDDQVMATAEHVDAMLSGDVTWSTNNDELTLSKPGAGTLIYRSVPSDDTSSDPGTSAGSSKTPS